MKLKKMIKYSKGITLISLIVTIIVLLILAGVTIATLVGDHGLISRAKKADKETLRGEAKEAIELGLANLKINEKGEKITSEIILNEEKGLTYVQPKASELNGNIDEVKGIYTNDNNKRIGFTVYLNDNNKVVIDGEEYTGTIVDPGSDGDGNGSSSTSPDTSKRDKNESLLMWVKSTDETGYYDVNITVGDETYTYPVYLCVKNEKQTTYSEDISLSGELNDEDFTNNILNERTLIYKYKGNLTINEGVTVTAYTTQKTNVYRRYKDESVIKNKDVPYQGPKGLIMYVEGTFLNSGKVTMENRGSNAAGQDVLLWKYADGNSLSDYYYVASSGGSGRRCVLLFK